MLIHLNILLMVTVIQGGIVFSFSNQGFVVKKIGNRIVEEWNLLPEDIVLSTTSVNSFKIKIDQYLRYCQGIHKSTTSFFLLASVFFFLCRYVFLFIHVYIILYSTYVTMCVCICIYACVCICMIFNSIQYLFFQKEAS